MQVEPSYLAEDGMPVYIVRLKDDCTGVCPNCKATRTNMQCHSKPYSVVPNLIGHFNSPGGCGRDEKRTFIRNSYVQFGDLPRILMQDYQDLLPFRSKHESVAEGVAVVLGQQLQTARSYIDSADYVRARQERELKLVWEFKVLCAAIAADIVTEAVSYEHDCLQEEAEHEMITGQQQAVKLKENCSAAKAKLRESQQKLVAKEEELRVTRNEVLAQKGLLAKNQEDIQTKSQQVAAAEARIKLKEEELELNRKRTQSRISACTDDLESAAKKLKSSWEALM